VHVWRNKLELSFPQLRDDSLEVCTGLVISDIEINRIPQAANRAMMVLKAGMQCLSAFA
jgi:hypothetical protein